MRRATARCCRIEQVVPVWRKYGAMTRVKLTLERRQTPVSEIAPAEERRRSRSEYL